MHIHFRLFLITACFALIAPIRAQDQAPASATATPAPAAANSAGVACTITAAAPLEAFTADGAMSGVSQSVVGQSYQCLRVENGKAVLQDATGKTFKIRADAVSQTPAASATSAATAAATPAPATAPAPAAAPAPSPTPTPSAYVPAGYNYVWGDEFNESSLDISKWWTRFIYNDGMLDKLNDEKERYRENNNHVFNGSELQLTARIVGGGYESGMVRSKETFKYGYFEARIKMPAGKGMWPAFWLNSDSNDQGKVTWPPEIDIFEFVNNVKDDKPNMLHMGAVDQRKKGDTTSVWASEELDGIKDETVLKWKRNGGNYFAPFQFPDDYHVFGLLWDTDDTVSWYVDGVMLVKIHYNWVITKGDDAPNAHVLLNLAMGGQWAGRYGIDNAAFPQYLAVDYVRIYQKSGGKMGTSTIGHDLYKAP